MILDTLAAVSKKRCEAAKEKISLKDMEALAYSACKQKGRELDFSFERTISSPEVSFICEVKEPPPRKE